MMRLGLVLGLGMAVGATAWVFGRHADVGPQARAAESTPAAEPDDDGTHDEAAYRYRTNQSRHWRHVMMGTR